MNLAIFPLTFCCRWHHNTSARRLWRYHDIVETKTWIELCDLFLALQPSVPNPCAKTRALLAKKSGLDDILYFCLCGMTRFVAQLIRPHLQTNVLLGDEFTACGWFCWLWFDLSGHSLPQNVYHNQDRQTETATLTNTSKSFPYIIRELRDLVLQFTSLDWKVRWMYFTRALNTCTVLADASRTLRYNHIYDVTKGYRRQRTKMFQEILLYMKIVEYTRRAGDPAFGLLSSREYKTLRNFSSSIGVFILPTSSHFLRTFRKVISIRRSLILIRDPLFYIHFPVFDLSSLKVLNFSAFWHNFGFQFFEQYNFFISGDPRRDLWLTPNELTKEQKIQIGRGRPPDRPKTTIPCI